MKKLKAQVLSPTPNSVLGPHRFGMHSYPPFSQSQESSGNIKSKIYKSLLL